MLDFRSLTLIGWARVFMVPPHLSGSLRLCWSRVPLVVAPGVLALCVAIAGPVAYAACARKTEQQLSGQLRQGSLQCQDSRNFSFIMDGRKPVRVQVKNHPRPDTLRDFPGVPAEVTVVGAYDDAGVFVVRLITARTGYVGRVPGLPPSCRD